MEDVFKSIYLKNICPAVEFRDYLLSFLFLGDFQITWNISTAALSDRLCASNVSGPAGERQTGNLRVVVGFPWGISDFLLPQFGLTPYT